MYMYQAEAKLNALNSREILFVFSFFCSTLKAVCFAHIHTCIHCTLTRTHTHTQADKHTEI